MITGLAARDLFLFIIGTSRHEPMMIVAEAARTGTAVTAASSVRLSRISVAAVLPPAVGMQVDAAVRPSALSAPPKSPKRLRGQAAKVKRTWRKTSIHPLSILSTY
jgi:hypothetical protein